MPLDCKPFAAPDGQNECQTACHWICICEQFKWL